MRPNVTTPEFVYSLLKAARLHGEDSEPDHEVGDLWALLIACWSQMSPEQRTLALSDPQVQGVIDGPEYVSLFE